MTALGFFGSLLLLVVLLQYAASASILRLEEPMDGDHRQPEDEITHDLDDPEDVIHPPCPFCCDCYAPCERKYDKTRLPDDGEYGVYNIRIREDTCTCKLLNKHHHIFNIRKYSGYTQTVFIIENPGYSYTNPAQYSTLNFADYRFHCPGATSIFFHFYDLSLQDEDCYGTCKDYVKLNGGVYGTSEFCGQNMPDQAIIYPGSSLRVTFRSNNAITSSGFVAAVVCYGAPPPAISCPAKRAAPLQHEEPFKDPEVPYDGPEIPVHEIDDGLHDFEFEDDREYDKTVTPSIEGILDDLLDRGYVDQQRGCDNHYRPIALQPGGGDEIPAPPGLDLDYEPPDLELEYLEPSLRLEPQ